MNLVTSLLLAITSTTTLPTKAKSIESEKQLDWKKFNSSILVETRRGEKIFTCSAVAIGKYMLLTSAHCVDGISSARAMLDITYDQNSSNSIEMAKYIMHPEYNSKKSLFKHDIAIVFLKEKLPSFVTPASIGSNHLFDVKTEINRIGFGGRNNINTRTWTNPKIEKLTDDGRNLVLNDQLSVIGDSGGPVYTQGKEIQLIGLHSTREGSDTTYSVYLPAYRAWLSKYISYPTRSLAMLAE